MINNIHLMKEYLIYQGQQYVNPKKAGSFAMEMEQFKQSGQIARTAFTELATCFQQVIPNFTMQKVSNWMNQAQRGRPHFWVYFQQEDIAEERPAIALRLLDQVEKLGISLEVSFVERKKSDRTLNWQNQVLELPIVEPLYYFVQRNGVSVREAGTESMRQQLLKEVAEGTTRKVQVKYDIPNIEEFESLDAIVNELKIGFETLMPYYHQTLSSRN